MNGIFTALLICSYVLLYAVIKHYYEKKTAKTYQGIMQILDRAVSGQIQAELYDESIEAALASRLNRIVQIASMHRQQAEKERDLVKSLVSNVSHQVRTPLANIMLYTGLLQEQPLPEQAALLAGRLEKQSVRLDFFIRELSRSTYAEQEIISLYPEQTDVLEMVRTACQAIELAAMKKGICLQVHSAAGASDKEPAEPLYCYADKKWTVEAVVNVLDNAVKYSPENSTIHIRTIPYDSFLCIQVSDSGPGIRETEQALVFRRFYRSSDVKHTDGFGIGLYLVREVLSKQGGYARIQSKYGSGTCVQMFLSRGNLSKLS